MKGGVRERSKGKWSYYFKYKDELNNWKTKEKGGFTSKKEAQTALRKAITEFEDNGLITNKTTYTLEQYINYYFTNVAELKLRYNTIRSYRTTAKVHINKDLGNINIEKITPKMLQEYFTKKSNECNSGTIAIAKKVLNSTFKLAVKHRVIKSNPMNSIESSVVKKESASVFLTKEEINTVIAEVKESEYYLPILIAIHTGMRRGEILGLTWEDVDLDSNTVDINKQLHYRKGGCFTLDSTKTKSSNRKLLIPDYLANELELAKKVQDEHKAYYDKNYYTTHNFVCCKEDGSPFIPDYLSNFTTKLSKDLGINFKFHDLRHSHASLLLEADVNIKVIQERLGHSKINTTLDVYSHVSQKLERESIDKFENLFCHQKGNSVANSVATNKMEAIN